MKKIQYSLTVKILTAILFVLFLSVAVVSTASSIYMADEGYYDPHSLSFFDTALCAQTTQSYADDIYYSYLYLSQRADPSTEDEFQLKQYQSKYAKENTNFFFTVTDEEENILLTNFEEQDYGTQKSYSYNHDNGMYDETYTLSAYVKKSITADDNYRTTYEIFNLLFSMRYISITAAALSALVALLLFIFLLCMAGHRKGEEGIVLSAQDKIPLDLYIAGIITVLLLLVNISISFFGMSYIVEVVYVMVCTIAVETLALALSMTLAARLKAGKWWENTVIYRLFHLYYKFSRYINKLICDVIANLPLLWKTVSIFTAYLFVNGFLVILLFSTHGEFFIFLLGLLFNMAALLGLCFVSLKMHKLKCGGKKIADGDYNSKIDTKYMFWDLKTHAESLNNIGRGMSKAVEERLKSERLKTELITNVSHDIKTPLTSIVNYVDLLKKENIENESAIEYIAVLDRQSARLKKLIEDLMEASKASTGNLTVNTARTDIVELLNQSVGEYIERFAASSLETIIRTPQKEVAILADGRLLWRVFDNLLNNICKYSQANTRVYLDIDIISSKVMITFKNISSYSLNITTDELLERFVRGDSSRATEGSGLGLSIAKSLTELQKGNFDLSVDGDLFKVVINFDSIT